MRFVTLTLMMVLGSGVEVGSDRPMFSSKYVWWALMTSRVTPTAVKGAVTGL